MGGGARQDESAGVAGIGDGIGLGDKPAEGIAEDDGPDEAERCGEGPHVVAPLFQCPQFRVRSRTTAIAALVEVDHLHGIGKAVEIIAQAGVIETRPAVQDYEGRPFAPRWIIHAQGSANTLEEQPRAVNFDVQGFTLRV